MRANLVPRAGGNPILLDSPIILIGRDEDCDIALESSEKVSRHHCLLVQCGEQYRLRDLGSTNGVRINRKRIIEAELRPGDEVAVADLAFTFQIGELPVMPAATFRQTQPERAPGQPDTVPLSADEPDLVPVPAAEDGDDAILGKCRIDIPS